MIADSVIAETLSCGKPMLSNSPSDIQSPQLLLTLPIYHHRQLVSVLAFRF